MKLNEHELLRLHDGDTTDEIAAYIGYPEIQLQIIIDAREQRIGALVITEAVEVVFT